jgi:adenylate kinase family enzyme
MKKLFVCVFGPIGSGKEGMTAALEREFGLIPLVMSKIISRKQHLDSGYLIRYPKIIGKNYPFEAVKEAFDDYLGLFSSQAEFVVDGVPRNTPQQVDMVLDQFDQEHQVIFVHMLCSRHVCEERVRGRREVMSRTSQGPRKDDKPDVVKGRLDEHFGDLDPILKRIGERKAVLLECDAELPQDQVIANAIRQIKQVLVQEEVLF